MFHNLTKNNKPFIPNKVSDLTDDSGHYTKPVSGIPASDLEETYLTYPFNRTYEPYVG